MQIYTIFQIAQNAQRKMRNFYLLNLADRKKSAIFFWIFKCPMRERLLTVLHHHEQHHYSFPVSPCDKKIHSQYRMICNFGD